MDGCVALKKLILTCGLSLSLLIAPAASYAEEGPVCDILLSYLLLQIVLEMDEEIVKRADEYAEQILREAEEACLSYHFE